MSPTDRRRLRYLHLILAAPVGAALYSPWPVADTVAAVLVFPLLAASGLFMWLGPRLRTRLARPAAQDRA